MGCHAQKTSYRTAALRGHSSAGRALAWHARGRRFDPAWLHHASPFRLRVAQPRRSPTGEDGLQQTRLSLLQSDVARVSPPIVQKYSNSLPRHERNPMRYVYIIRSVAFPDQEYVGATADLKQRLSDHDAGRSPHTSKYKPWTLIWCCAFPEK